jgi:tetratricopeptide (TPR) repeat protein
MLMFLAWMGNDEEEMAGTFEQGRALAESRGDPRALGQLHLHYGIWRGLTRNDMADFGQHVRQAADLAEQVGDEGAAIAAAAGLALAGYIEGRVPDAIAIGKRALEPEPDDLRLGSEYWMPSPVVWLMGLTRNLEGLAGRPAEGLAGLERPIRLFRSQKSPLGPVIMHLWATQQAELVGDAAAAMAHAQQMREETQGLGVPGVSWAGSHFCLGIAQLLGGNSKEAVGSLERALALHDEAGGGPPVEVVGSWCRLAVAYADLGQTERARDTSSRGLASLRERRLPVFLTPALTMHAQVLRKTQGAEAREEIEASLTEAEALVESTGIRSWQPFIHVERAELARLVGDETTHERELHEAHRLFTEMGAIGHAKRVARELKS